MLLLPRPSFSNRNFPGGRDAVQSLLQNAMFFNARNNRNTRKHPAL